MNNTIVKLIFRIYLYEIERMGIRARLRYNNIPYYDKDIKSACEAFCEYNKVKFNKYMIDRNKNIIIVYCTEYKKSGLKELYFTFDDLAEYCRNNKHVSINLSNGLKYNEDDLNQIAQNVASIWGGSCYKYTVDYQNKIVSFECIEHGECFESDLRFDELEEYR